jgi:hypothetical protein
LRDPLEAFWYSGARVACGAENVVDGAVILALALFPFLLAMTVSFENNNGQVACTRGEIPWTGW